MFVKSRMEKDVTYRRKGTSWIIKAKTVTYIDENKVTAKELKQFYGDRIDIISRDSLDKEEAKIPVKKEVRIPENKETETSRKSEDIVIENIIKEIKEEAKKDSEGVQGEVIDPIREAFMSGADSLAKLDDIFDDSLVEIEEIPEKIEIPEVKSEATVPEVNVKKVKNKSNSKVVNKRGSKRGRKSKKSSN